MKIWLSITHIRSLCAYSNIQQSGNSASLIIPHLESKDEGVYTCVAQSLNDKDSSLRADIIVNIINSKFCNNVLCTFTFTSSYSSITNK